MKKTIEILLIVIGLALLFFAIPHEIGGTDGRDRYRGIAKIIERGSFSTTPYSIIGPVFAVPLYYLDKSWVVDPTHPAWWCARFNVILFIIGLLVLARLLTPHVEAGVVRRFLLILIGASMFPNHTRTFYGDMFSAMVVGVGILTLYTTRSVLGWGACVLGVANAPASAVGFAFVVAAKIRENKRLRYALALLAVVMLVLGENWLRRGQPFHTNYEHNHGVRTSLPYSGLTGFSYPFFFGILSLLFSFGKGLLFFAPGMLLCFSLRKEWLADNILRYHRSLLLFVAGLILVYARWWAWYGGFTWGPRFLLIASIPASLALALCLEKASSLALRILTLGVLVFSVWVGVNGAVFNQDNLDICTENGYALECLSWYTPEFSVLWRPFVIRRTLHTPDSLIIAYGVLVVSEKPLDDFLRDRRFIQALATPGQSYRGIAGLLEVLQQDVHRGGGGKHNAVRFGGDHSGVVGNGGVCCVREGDLWCVDPHL